MKTFKLGFLCLSLFFFGMMNVVAHAEGDSAYSRFRIIFNAAIVPTAQSLQPSKNWYCSGDLKAAKGIFRYVDYWEPSYFFELASDQLTLNKGPRPGKEFKWQNGQFYASWEPCPECREVREFIRVTRRGDLVVEITRLIKQGLQIWSDPDDLKPAVSDGDYRAHLYMICQNLQDDGEWFERGDLWSESK